MVFVASTGFAQNQTPALGKIDVPQYLTNPIPKRVIHFPLQKNDHISVPVVAADFYVTQLGFFCKQEIKLEKITKIPFKFRLGSVESCDRLEGKFKYK